MNKPQKIIGTLLPLTALAGFENGYSFIDWLEKTKQSAWQLLPLHETQLETGSRTKHVPSPYKSYSIGLDPKYLLNLASESQDPKNLEIFIENNKAWIDEYALFCALRDHFGTDEWTQWDSDLVTRNPEVLAEWAEKLKENIDSIIKQQAKLHETYAAFHAYARSKGILLIGDLPFYPSFRSPLVWAHQEVFQIGKDGTLPFVSGIPDTPGTHFGRQVWGHPLYNWANKEDHVLKFWKMRLKYLSSIFDQIRFDHAKAFFSYGVMEAGNPEGDYYAKGPGEEVFKSLVDFAQQQGMKIFVEDSGDRTKEIRAVINEMSIPGLRIFKFALKGGEIHERYSDIANYPENCVAYTTTHDTETLLGYLQILSPEQKHELSKACGVAYDADDKQFAVGIRNAIVESSAKTVIIPLQDWLLTTDRINIPGTEKEIGDTNWQFQVNMPIGEIKS